MGAAGHSRVVDFDGRDLKTIWKEMVDSEEGEDGRRGNFAAKDEGFVLIARTSQKVERDLLRQAQLLIQWGPNPSSYDPAMGSVGFDPMTVDLTTFCRNCGGRGKQKIPQPVTLADGSQRMAEVPTECPHCAGSGRAPVSADELAKRKTEVALRSTAVKVFGLNKPTLQRANELFADKWGPAVAISAANLVLFTGMCHE